MSGIADPDLVARLDFARSLARRAGALGRDYFMRTASLAVEVKGPQDFVTEGDRAVEALIRGELARAFPADTMFGEEDGGSLSERTWFVDPIDGTINFLHGVRYWCISIALVVGGVRELGLIYDPSLDELFWARRGHGAFVNQTPIRVSNCRRLDLAFVAAGYVHRHDAEEHLALRRRLLAAGVLLKDMGAGALMLAHVAAGRYDAFYEPHMHPWDALAGLTLIEAAGGSVAPYPGPSGLEVGGRVLGGAPEIHAALETLIGT